MELTCASICSGGKLADFGLMAAGYVPLWGIEPIEAIADVANVNVPARTLRQKAQDVRWGKLERPGLLWASPPCPSFSQAKTNGVETAEDEGIAQAICDALRVLTPPTFVLENVIPYHRSRSLARIRATLDDLGYWSVLSRINAADMGVPQTRRRLVLRAVRGGFVPHLPRAVKWVGWYSAVADIIDTLPESKFADWQLARLDRLTTSAIVDQTTGMDRENGGRKLSVRASGEPIFTVVAQSNRQNIRAFLVDGQNGGRPATVRFEDEPVMTIAAAVGHRPANAPRAFIVHPTDQRTMPVRDEADPIWTLTAGSNATRNPDMRPRAWLDGGRVVKMTPRALGRFQSLPDSYQLPDKAGLATRVIGNGVACLMAQRIGDGLAGIIGDA